ncbi:MULTISPECIES: hypothetical protein [unclassified Microbacterium]|uniref:hypothetical protein n=1 Tax=unclassified Microbacterium TaxID=2609290 RepID=UPI00097BE784|nr:MULTISPECIES: hypothetical protein [unclassified Microbacterium]MDI9890609.1 hypothetical protein [Microbacterium sp. IEGM 1404]MXS73205.1 hypothetical protein [Microbacterium sp. TL13]ONI66124.1 hypothetical protein CSIV_03260 [Microbacterium sp. CSI-V]
MTRRAAAAGALGVLVAAGVVACAPATAPAPLPDTGYPWHTDIVATTFWVGEVFDPSASDGSQRLSTYDSRWLASYGGCDGVSEGTQCRTEPRTAENGYFPTRMTPLENPFYLDLPYDDVNDDVGFAERGKVIPWASEAPYAADVADPTVSLMKNRWVVLRKGDRLCYGQIQDAGPGEYRDAAYVFGSDDRRPDNTRFNGAGLDVSPALNGCLGFRELDGEDDRVDWAFVDEDDVPDGPWTRIVTTSPVR